MSIENVRPLRDYVCIQPEASATASGSIYIPEAHREKPRRGKVLSVGPGRVLESGRRVEPEVRVGDVVLFARHHTGQALAATDHVDYRNKDGDGPLMIRESELLAVVEG